MLLETRRVRRACVALWLAASGCHQNKHAAQASGDDARSTSSSGRSNRPNDARARDEDAGPSAAAGNRSTPMGSARSNSAPRAGVGARDASAEEDAGADTPAASSGKRAVTIRFHARIGSFDFACGQTYRQIGTNNTTITPQDLRVFVQDLQLIRRDGRFVPVELDIRKPWQSAELALLDFEDGTGSCGEGDSETNTELTGRVPEGDYHGVSFSNGVPETLNHADPLTLGDPLRSHPGMSWGWLDGFRFAKLELREVVGPNQPFSRAELHVGSSACKGDARMGSVHCDKSNRNRVVLNDFDPGNDTIILDIAPIFAETNASEMAECHATEAGCAPMFKAFGVDFATGNALAAQSIYGVE
jgi:uncharacterized repeat protein (TIGR04052 family)